MKHYQKCDNCFTRVLFSAATARASAEEVASKPSVDSASTQRSLTVEEYIAASEQTMTAVSGVDRIGCVRAALHSSLAAGDLLGCQIAVLQHGRVLVDLCGGVLDPYEKVSRLVGGATINCFVLYFLLSVPLTYYHNK